MPYIQLCIPDIIIIFQNSHLSHIPGTGYLLDRLKLLVNILHFLQSAVVSSGIIQNPMPVNLRSHGTGSPAEKADKIRPMSHTLHGPQRHLTRLWCRCRHSCIPSIGTGLLLHNPENRGCGANLHQIFTPHSILHSSRKSLIIFFCVGKVWIRVVCHKIQTFLSHLVIIQITKETIGSNKISRLYVFSHNVTL